MKYVVCGACESIDTAKATGRSKPLALSVGATYVVTLTLPDPLIVLKEKKSYSLGVR